MSGDAKLAVQSGFRPLTSTAENGSSPTGGTEKRRVKGLPGLVGGRLKSVHDRD